MISRIALVAGRELRAERRQPDGVVAAVTFIAVLVLLESLVVGPVIDVKLFSMQVGTFGRAVAIRFAPLSFLVAIGCAIAAGVIFLGGFR